MAAMSMNPPPNDHVEVFDEADRLFELGFAEQLQKILDATPSSRQCSPEQWKKGTLVV